MRPQDLRTADPTQESSTSRISITLPSAGATLNVAVMPGALLLPVSLIVADRRKDDAAGGWA